MREKVVLGCAGSVGGQISVYIIETFSIRTQPPAHTAPSALITVNESFTLWYRLSIELVNFLVPYKTIYNHSKSDMCTPGGTRIIEISESELAFGVYLW